jgi:hypothetical protein
LTVSAVEGFMLPGELAARVRAVVRMTRPVHPDTEAALARRWRELPASASASAQLLGRRTPGCEGTRGVFPRCNLACTPCYHSREANRVRVDGDHTVAEVERQMAHLRSVRGIGQHAQLIGGEVTLLGPEEHGRALEAMIRHGRKPMSMTHGDFDYDYLERLAVDASGRPRFRSLSFAGHFDSLMQGRRDIPRPRSERELHPYRARFVEMFRRLQREHGVRSHLAHNMTVTPHNLAEVADVVRACLGMGFDMLSFQPAAYVGNPSRWKGGDYRSFGADDVWREVERGAGTRLPWAHLQMGDPRCNRSAYGLLVGRRWVPVLDDRDARDLLVRDAFLDSFGGMDFDDPWPLVAARVARVLARRPGLAVLAAGWVARFARRAGLVQLLRGRARPVTFVMHSFMDARDVRPAWKALERGELLDDPHLRCAGASPVVFLRDGPP